MHSAGELAEMKRMPAVNGLSWWEDCFMSYSDRGVGLKYHRSFRDVYDFDATITLPHTNIHFTQDAAYVQAGFPSLDATGAVMSDRLSFDVDIAPPLGILFIAP
jgi:hypothetical protein